MRSGKLRHPITIQTFTEARDTVGQPVESWVLFATVRASVEPLQGREYFASQQVQAEVTIRFRIRYLSGILPTMRILFDSRTFEIESVINPNERNHELHLMCREVVDG